MKTPKYDIKTICRTFNECGSLKKTAEILGLHLRTVQLKVQKEAKYKLEPR